MAIHALWCHPRSVSTAFERIMRARGDLDVLHEPFMYHYYLNRAERMFPDFVPEPGHPRTYGDIRAMILSRAEARPVFFKDMAYYIADELAVDTAFARQMTHAFLIRDPAEAIVSYARRDPDFTQTELGFAAQHRLYDVLVATGHTPLVITADQLRNAPQATMRRYWTHAGLAYMAGAFSWDDSVPEGWQSVVGWHGDVLERGAIEPPNEGRDYAAELAALGAPFVEYDRHHRPHFDALNAIAARQAHQK